jgi:hypothetical protein
LIRYRFLGARTAQTTGLRAVFVGAELRSGERWASHQHHQQHRCGHQQLLNIVKTYFEFPLQMSGFWILA